ncbi:26506_t:CDS:10, partial [Dentiscutata erythropus]
YEILVNNSYVVSAPKTPALPSKERQSSQKSTSDHYQEIEIDEDNEQYLDKDNYEEALNDTRRKVRKIALVRVQKHSINSSAPRALPPKKNNQYREIEIDKDNEQYLDEDNYKEKSSQNCSHKSSAPRASTLPSKKNNQYQEIEIDEDAPRASTLPSKKNNQYREIEIDENNKQYSGEDNHKETSDITRKVPVRTQTRNTIDPASRASTFPSKEGKSSQKTSNQNQRIKQPTETIVSDRDHEEISINNAGSHELNITEILSTSSSKHAIKNSTSKTSCAEITASSLMAAALSTKSTSSFIIEDESNSDSYDLMQNSLDTLRNAFNEFELLINIQDVMTAKILNNSNENEISSNLTHLHNSTHYRQEINKELIVQVCSISKANERMPALVRDLGCCFDNYRYKLHVSIMSLAEKGEPSDDNLSEFITKEVWKQVLSLHLKVTDQQALMKNLETFMKLGVFVRQAVKAVIIAESSKLDTKTAIRKCDNITINLKIPTKLGIVKSLPVKDLLNC